MHEKRRGEYLIPGVFCKRLFYIIQQKPGDAQPASSGTNGYIKLVGTVKIGASGGEKAEAEAHFPETHTVVLGM